LSPRGKEALPLAQEIIERINELQRRSQHGRRLDRELRVGASNTVGNYMVGELLGPFIARHPQVSLCQRRKYRTHRCGLIEHNLDVGCIEGPVNHPQLETFAWRDDELGVCASPAHPLARRATLKPSHFEGAQWILRESGSAMRTQAERALASLPQGVIVLELGRSKRSNRPSLPAWALPAYRARRPDSVLLAGCRFWTLLPDLRRRLSLVLHKSRYRGALIEAFLESLLGNLEGD